MGECKWIPAAKKLAGEASAAYTRGRALPSRTGEGHADPGYGGEQASRTSCPYSKPVTEATQRHLAGSHP